MAANNEWFEFHLTPNGWVKGSYRLDNGITYELDTPNDRVLTIKREDQVGHYANPSSMTSSFSTTFEHADSVLLNGLKERHGELPPARLL